VDQSSAVWRPSLTWTKSLKSATGKLAKVATPELSVVVVREKLPVPGEAEARLKRASTRVTHQDLKFTTLIHFRLGVKKNRKGRRQYYY
jgi:hypothetical protein